MHRCMDGLVSRNLLTCLAVPSGLRVDFFFLVMLVVTDSTVVAAVGFSALKLAIDFNTGAGCSRATRPMRQSMRQSGWVGPPRPTPVCTMVVHASQTQLQFLHDTMVWGTTTRIQGQCHVKHPTGRFSPLLEPSSPQGAVDGAAVDPRQGRQEIASWVKIDT